MSPKDIGHLSVTLMILGFLLMLIGNDWCWLFIVPSFFGLAGYLVD